MILALSWSMARTLKTFDRAFEHWFFAAYLTPFDIFYLWVYGGVMLFKVLSL